jgi:hypothetical protein
VAGTTYSRIHVYTCHLCVGVAQCNVLPQLVSNCRPLDRQTQTQLLSHRDARKICHAALTEAADVDDDSHAPDCIVQVQPRLPKPSNTEQRQQSE